MLLRAGLLSHFSTIALASVSLALSAGSISAADLGSPCCADLEDRIAELEAATSRGGDRKMSLTISGQVSRVIMHWDDGKSSQTYYGLDNGNYNSRFGFRGEATIAPSVKTGFEIQIRQSAGGTSAKASQLDEDGKAPSFVPNVNIAGCPDCGVPSFNAHNVDAYFADARSVKWWIEHAEIGRLTVGRSDGASVWGTINLTGQLWPGASPSFILLNGGFFIRGPKGEYYSMVWGNIGDPAVAYGRTELVRYDTPSWKGFIYSASIAEAGDYWGTMLRYASEHGGVRIAGQVGYERATDVATLGVVDPANAAYTGRPPNITAWGFALSALHIPTGLFVQGHYNAVDYGGQIIGAASGYWGEVTQHKKPVDQWLIQSGVSTNWFNYGKTSSLWRVRCGQ